MTASERFCDVARGLRWYVRGVVRADAYERYVEHHRRAHPGVPPMGEREFWRAVTDERPVTMRCC